MNRKTLLVAISLALALALMIFGVALAASKADTNGPDNPDCVTRITIIKDAEPPNGQNFTFSVTRSGDGFAWNPTLSDHDTSLFPVDVDGVYAPSSASTSGVLYNKTYTIVENTPPDSWMLKKVSCSATNSSGTPKSDVTFNYTANGVSFYLPDYRYVTCTFTNAASMDYGDLPDIYGMTTFAQDGARHFPGNLFLGSTVDTESDGQESSDASGDGSDEDGVARISLWGTSPLGKGTLRITSSGEGCLRGWLDFGNESTGDLGADSIFSSFTYTAAGGDNKFYDEYIIQNVHVLAGTADYTFDIPEDFGPAVVYGRFRLLTLEDGGCIAGQAPSSITSLSDGGLKGFANNGEVEDYSWGFGPSVVSLQSLSGEAASATPIISLMIVVLSVSVLSILWRILHKAQG
jgi:hypothetical protein